MAKVKINLFKDVVLTDTYMAGEVGFGIDAAGRVYFLNNSGKPIELVGELLAAIVREQIQRDKPVEPR